MLSKSACKGKPKDFMARIRDFDGRAAGRFYAFFTGCILRSWRCQGSLESQIRPAASLRPKPKIELGPDRSNQEKESRMKLAVPCTPALLIILSLARGVASAQTPPVDSPAASESEGGTSNDLFIMFGSDLDRPGLEPRANYNIGLGHTFAFLKNNPIGDELTFGYTYENGGTHGFLHSQYGADTEALGIMKNFRLPKTKRLTGYTWIQGGITSMTGNPSVRNRFYDGESLGLIVHCNDHNSIWIQETFNKVVTVPWYTTASIGYTRSW
jgi:hypothetical protein